MISQALTIFHNPSCSTSRKVLAILREAGKTPVVVEYLKTGWTRETLDDLLVRMNAEPKSILRTKEALSKALGLDQPGVAPHAILDAMIAHPVLVERPIVSGPKGAAVCRPIETVERLI